MSKKKNKAQQVKKVAAETKVDAKDLDRLPQDALEKLDALVPDVDGDDLLGGDAPESPSSEGGDLSNDEAGDTADSEGVGGTTSEEHGSEEDELQDVRDGSLDSSGSEGSSDSEPSGDSEVAGEDVGSTPAESSEVGTVVVGEVIGGDFPSSETPQSDDEVETEEGQGSSEDTIPSGTRTDDVVKDRVLVGYHPVTGKPVYSDEQ